MKFPSAHYDRVTRKTRSRRDPAKRRDPELTFAQLCYFDEANCGARRIRRLMKKATT